MAVELVTGYAGKAHVSSSEDGARQAGTVGTGMYVLETVAEPLKATLENANTVTVGPGDVLINGRHVQLTGSTTFAVPVGTQGMQTSNLLVLRYELAEEGTESVTAITLTGEPAASDPQDPELATGSVLGGGRPVGMPLYRVVTTGIESAQPVKLFETIPPIAGLTLADLSGTLPVSKGGTGATSAAAARTSLGLGEAATRDVWDYGSGTDMRGQVAGFTTDGTLEIGPTLDFHSIGSSSDFDFRVSIDGSGSPSFSKPLPVSSGGTGATTSDAARSNLGLDGQTGYLKAGRGSISDMSRNTLYNLAPGTYLVANNATNGPESGSHGNLLVSYSGGNRIVGLLAYDNGHVYTTYSSSASGTFLWKRVDNDGYGQLLWSGTCGFGGSIPGLASNLSRYKVALVQTSWSDTFLIPCSVTTGSDGLVHVIGSTLAMSRPGPGGAALTVNMIQSGTSMLVYASSHEYSGSWWDGAEDHQGVTRIVGVA